MALSGRMTRKLLEGEAIPGSIIILVSQDLRNLGTASTIEVLDVHIGKPRVRTKLVPGPESTNCPHTVLKVRSLSGNETWILDPAGCQYGFREVLVPFEKYLADKSAKVVSEPTTYEWTETKDLDFFSTIKAMNKAQAQREDREVERQAREHFAVFVDKHVSKSMLNGTASEFESKLDSFAQELKVHMQQLTK
jgi:hypothetical protein